MGLEKQLEYAKLAAKIAGKEILKVYGSDDFHVEFKDRKDPVCLADKNSNSVICNLLNQNFKDYGILTEESIKKENDSINRAVEEWRLREYSWIIDPLDGTKDFIDKTGEFGVLIGLIYQGNPVLGVNYYPISNTFYYATIGNGAYKEGCGINKRIHVSDVSEIKDLKLVVSRPGLSSEIERFIASNRLQNPAIVGSLGLKASKIAEGLSDLYLLFSSRSSLWDISSSSTLIDEAGGKITDCSGNRFSYDKESTRNNNGVVVSNGKNHDKIIDILRDYIK